jgi:hypothetical protein
MHPWTGADPVAHRAREQADAQVCLSSALIILLPAVSVSTLTHKSSPGAQREFRVGAGYEDAWRT